MDEEIIWFVSPNEYQKLQASDGEPQFSEVTDHYYLTGGQDDFVHRIKVRAFKPKTVVGYLVSGVPTP